MRKVMHSTDHSGRIIHYIPARLTEGKDWFVSFYAEDPFTGQMRRKRIKLNRIKGLAERRRYARDLVEQINKKLRAGWNPFTEAVAPKGAELFSAAVALFLKRKRVELRPDSMRSYDSHSDRLLTWLKLRGKQNLMSAAFTPYICRDYMEHVLDLGVSARTYNNYIVFGRVLFNWMKERHYCADNPFDSIKRMKEKEKFRKIIPEDMRQRISEHLAVHDPDFLRACMIMFYAEIRPAEQMKLVIGNIDLKNRVIHVPAHAAKNGEARWPTIGDALMPYLLSLPWDRLSSNSLLIGKDFVPGGEPVKRTDQYTRRWSKLRKELKLPKQYQFYSLRDSGIVHMINNKVPMNEVMMQAAHADLTTTTKYVRFANPEAVDALKGLKKGF